MQQVRHELNLAVQVVDRVPKHRQIVRRWLDQMCLHAKSGIAAPFSQFLAECVSVPSSYMDFRCKRHTRIKCKTGLLAVVRGTTEAKARAISSTWSDPAPDQASNCLGPCQTETQTSRSSNDRRSRHATQRPKAVL